MVLGGSSRQFHQRCQTQLLSMLTAKVTSDCCLSFVVEVSKLRLTPRQGTEHLIISIQKLMELITVPYHLVDTLEAHISESKYHRSSNRDKAPAPASIARICSPLAAGRDQNN